MTKFIFFILTFGVLHSLLDLPAVPASRFAMNPPCLYFDGLCYAANHFAGQAGILRFAFELRRE